MGGDTDRTPGAGLHGTTWEGGLPALVEGETPSLPAYSLRVRAPAPPGWKLAWNNSGNEGVLPSTRAGCPRSQGGCHCSADMITRWIGLSTESVKKILRIFGLAIAWAVGGIVGLVLLISLGFLVVKPTETARFFGQFGGKRPGHMQLVAGSPETAAAQGVNRR